MVLQKDCVTGGDNDAVRDLTIVVSTFRTFQWGNSKAYDNDLLL